MSNINHPHITSIEDFVDNIFLPNPKNILIWDTCSLLEILRFPYRGGNLNTFKLINKLNALITSDTIYSVCSELTITEWNDHQESVRLETEKSLTKTSEYHENSISIINDILGSGHVSISLTGKQLTETFEIIADQILSKTIFVQTETIANDALQRVAQKKPPGSKKPEFKDCAIWETSLSISAKAFAKATGRRTVFFTVNTDDYVDKGRTPKTLFGTLITDAVTASLDCVLTFNETHDSITK